MATVGTPSPSTSATRLSPPLDTARIIKRLSDSRKAQVPYYTGWDTKPNSCLKLIADIESEESYKRKVKLAQACTVLENSQQRRKYLQEDEAGGQETCTRKTHPKSKIVTPSPPPNASKELRESTKTNVVVQSAKELEDYIRRKEGGYDHYRDFPDLPDDDEDSTDLSLHCVDSPVSSLKHSLSLSPSSFHDLNISEIKSDSSRGDASSFRNKAKVTSSLKSALSSSTPVRSPSSIKKVHFECSDSQDKSASTIPSFRSGTFSLLKDEEYDDFGESPAPARLEYDITPKETPPCLYIQSPVVAKIRKSLDEYERQRIEKWREDVEAKAHELTGHSDKVDDPSMTKDAPASLDSSHEKLKLLFRKSDARRQQFITSVQQQQKLKEIELDQEDKQIEATKKLELEKRNIELELEKELEAAESAALAALERQEREKLQKQKEEEEAQLRAKEEAAAAEERRKNEELRVQEQQLLKEQQQAEQSAKTAIANAKANSQQGVPPEFRSAVLQSDLYAYVKLQHRLDEIKEAVKDISSTNPRTKEFYFAAMKVVNTPINSISNLSSDHLQQKVYHFIQLLEGKPVHIGDSMKKPFVASSEPNGDLFVQNLLAFRFVKKSEAEITRGMSGLTPMANLGVQLIRRFPALGTLIRANFYKMCPFLVPLIYPRTENMTNEQYASALGHEQLGGTERTIQQVLLERLGGYCTLYGIMVNIVERAQLSDLQPEDANFFSLKEVWRILATTMKLEPQVDVTCAVLLALLETSCDSLYKTFRSQFRKLMNQLSSTYLRKIRNITPPAQAASLTRLELFLEAQIPKLR